MAQRVSAWMEKAILFGKRRICFGLQAAEKIVYFSLHKLMMNLEAPSSISTGVLKWRAMMHRW